MSHRPGVRGHDPANHRQWTGDTCQNVTVAEEGTEQSSVSVSSGEIPGALFHTLDSQALSVIVAMGVGAAGIASGAGMGAVADAYTHLFSSPSGQPVPPHWIFIRVKFRFSPTICIDTQRHHWVPLCGVRP